MKDTELYARFLGLEAPWRVGDVLFRPQERSVTVFVSADPQAHWSCPECARPVPRYDKRRRKWRHLDTLQFKTLLEAEVPRVRCPEHGVRQVQVPWAEAARASRRCLRRWRCSGCGRRASGRSRRRWG